MAFIRKIKTPDGKTHTPNRYKRPWRCPGCGKQTIYAVVRLQHIRTSPRCWVRACEFCGQLTTGIGVDRTIGAKTACAECVEEAQELLK